MVLVSYFLMITLKIGLPNNTYQKGSRMLSTSTQRRTAASNKRLETSIGNLKMPKGTVFVTIHNTLNQLLI